MTKSNVIITILIILSIIIIIILIRYFIVDRITIKLGLLTIEFKKKH